MNIKIRYENQTMTVDVPEEDFSLMIQLDYEKQLEEADDPSSVQRRTPQEIMDERFNKPDYNNWHTHWRHIDDNAKPPAADGSGRYLSDDFEGFGEAERFTMDDFPDMEAMETQRRREREEEIKARIRKKLKPDYAEMLIAVDMEGMSVTDYAAQIGETRTAVSHRLQRAEKKFEEIFGKRPV